MALLVDLSNIGLAQKFITSYRKTQMQIANPMINKEMTPILYKLFPKNWKINNTFQHIP